jgi:hypothetical protein
MAATKNQQGDVVSAEERSNSKGDVTMCGFTFDFVNLKHLTPADKNELRRGLQDRQRKAMQELKGLNRALAKLGAKPKTRKQMRQQAIASGKVAELKR